ncbi:MAG: hypothetical protein ACLTOV_14035 [Phocaeicola sp.]
MLHEPLLHTHVCGQAAEGCEGGADAEPTEPLAAPLKEETYVLDFVNKAEDIQEDFQRYYKKTILSHETDVNKLSDKLAVCDQSMMYEEEEVELFNQKYWSGAPGEEIDPILDVCVQRFKELSDSDDNNQQIEVKSAMKQFVRLYEFLTALMDIQRIDWEKKNTFFHFLLRKLPKIGKEDWTEGLARPGGLRQVPGGEREKTGKSWKLENVNATVEPHSGGRCRYRRTGPQYGNAGSYRR